MVRALGDMSEGGEWGLKMNVRFCGWKISHPATACGCATMLRRVAHHNTWEAPADRSKAKPAQSSGDAGLEVAVAGQHGGAHEACILIRLVDPRQQLPAVADARHAAVAHGAETLGVEGVLQAALLEVLRDDLRMGWGLLRKGATCS